MSLRVVVYRVNVGVRYLDDTQICMRAMRRSSGYIVERRESKHVKERVRETRGNHGERVLAVMEE